MELKELTRKTLELFGCKDIAELQKNIMSTIQQNDFNKYESFCQLIDNELNIDWLQKIFQYYYADRKYKKQDYTPKSLAELCSRLTECENEKIVIDLCAGSGALTIQKWNSNNSFNFICFELDETVIPFLLFNLAIRNINGYVVNGNALSGEVVKTYQITKGDKFSTITECKEIKIQADTCISNPPFNLKWTLPVFSQLQSRFSKCELPPESNANYAFVLTALDWIKEKASFILPNGALTTDNKQEKEIIKYLVDKNLIESVILCPRSMFESTDISTCILTVNKHKKHTFVEFIDMRKIYEEETREQNGQFGGAAHENRTYKKSVNVFTNDHIASAVKSIAENENISEFCKSVSLNKIASNNYTLQVSRYIDFEIKENQHRKYGDIIDDINRIIDEKNALKLTMNETIAKAIGIFDIYSLCKQSEKTADEMSESLSFTGKKIKKENFITLSKNKNEFKFENMSKEKLSTILMSILQMWKQHIMYLNEEENRYLIELRDALLPDLMSGKIELK